jgi:3-methyl-2-oxobutanoate hydroxymethyltransferase
MPEEKPPRVTIPALQARKKTGPRIVCLTAYDYPTARILDETGEVDIILVGDSVGMTVLGYESTVPVTMDEMVHHTKAVARGVKRALVVGDMPYLSFHLSEEESVRNAARFIKEAGADAVKLEGATPKRLKLVEALTEAEIPVMGHVGLTPQSIRRLGQYRVQGSSAGEAGRLVREARNLESAGAFSVVIESVPMETAARITEALRVPTIGIGAGPACDGQVLVFHDMVGITTGYLPKFVRKYADLRGVISEAVRGYARDVREGRFPDDETSYHLKPAASTAAGKRTGAAAARGSLKK